MQVKIYSRGIEGKVVPPAPNCHRLKREHFPSLLGLWLPTAIGLVIRLVYTLVAASRQIHSSYDVFWYRTVASLIVSGHWYVLPLPTHPVSYQPTADHPPLFSLLLAGGDAIGLRSVDSQLVLLAILGGATVILCGLAGRRIGGTKAGIVTAWLAALYPGLWLFGGQVLVGQLAILIVAGTLLTVYTLRERQSTLLALLLGALVGMATLTRPELALLMVAFVPLWVVKGDFKHRIRLTVIYVAGAVLVVGPWAIRNLETFSRTEIVSTDLGATIAGANWQAVYHGPALGLWISSPSPPEAIRGHPSVVDHYLQQEGLRYITDHSHQAIGVALARLGRALEMYPTPSNQVYFDSRSGFKWPTWASWLYFVTFLPMLAGAALGSVLMIRRRVLVWPLMVPVAIYLLVSVAFYYDPRFSLDTQVALVILLGSGVSLPGRHSSPPRALPAGLFTDAKRTSGLAGNKTGT